MHSKFYYQNWSGIYWKIQAIYMQWWFFFFVHCHYGFINMHLKITLAMLFQVYWTWFSYSFFIPSLFRGHLNDICNFPFCTNLHKVILPNSTELYKIQIIFVVIKGKERYISQIKELYYLQKGILKTVYF